VKLCYSPAIPDIINDFSISYNNSSWIISAYLISGAVAAPIFGKLSDIHGSKKTILIIMKSMTKSPVTALVEIKPSSASTQEFWVYNQ
jgi:MFS family permease